MDLVTVVIPTLDRPECLRRALASVLSQTGLDEFALEIVVVDNSRSGGAMAGLAGDAVRWVHAPNPGVANARNAGVKAARGRWVAFLDDEEASPRGLAPLLAVARRTGADAVFGPIEGRAEGGREIGAFSPYFSRRIDRADGADVTALAAYLGANNSLFDRARCFACAGTAAVSHGRRKPMSSNGRRRAGSPGPMCGAANSSAARSAYSCATWPPPGAGTSSRSG